MTGKPIFCVYVLLGERAGRRYIGSTKDVPHRLAKHNDGHSYLQSRMRQSIA